ncbi:spermatogenesis-associated protein 17 [Blyttiomyces sp. JEL0837]|nr:spermatogenesis-associated protein 17 [Blyttiomyces sp. JEL0837]
MALAFAQIWGRHGSDIVEEFFEMAREAEEHRVDEYAKVVKLEAFWRGQRAREKLKKQIWRGYWSRKHVFDFYARKVYIAEIVDKMDQMRTSLREYEAAQQKLDRDRRQKALQEKLERMAGRRHHLVGTKAIPGVMAKVTEPTIPEVETATVPFESLMSLDSRGNYVDGEFDGYEGKVYCPGGKGGDGIGDGGVGGRNNTAMLPPLVRVPESHLRNNKALREWVKSHVGTNPRGIRVKPPREEESDGTITKAAQGPFLPLVRLKKRKTKPFKPTLRVETDFYDTKNYQMEERRRELAERVSDKVFVTLKHVVHPPGDLYLGGGPYKLQERFRDVDPSKFLSKKDFKSVLAPVPLFDDFMDY